MLFISRKTIILIIVIFKGKQTLASVYVPLSRVKRLVDIKILRSFSRSVLFIEPDPDLKAEYLQLQIIAKSTIEKYEYLMVRIVCAIYCTVINI